MIFETEFGKFKLLKNHRQAFDLDAFVARYDEPSLKTYDVLVGDVSSDKLRLKGFDPKNKNKKKQSKFIPDYLNECCNYNTPYYILERIIE